MLSALFLIVLALLRRPRAHLPQLVPLVALLPLATYLSYGRSTGLIVALVLMAVTVSLEVSRLVSPRWNRTLIKRIKPILGPREYTRPLSISSAAVGVALLISLTTEPVAFIAGLAGLLIPSLRGSLALDLSAIRHVRLAVLRPRVLPYVSMLGAVILVVILTAPLAGPAWGLVSLSCLAAGVIAVLPIPIDPYLLAPVAAAAVLSLA